MNIMELSSDQVATLKSIFPDSTEVCLVDDALVVETLWENGEFGKSFHATRLDLLEIEPETGIFACMSPVTKRLYVFIKDYAPG